MLHNHQSKQPTMQTETYISTTELQNRFRITQGYRPNFGAFLVVRWLYSISAEGGKGWQRVLFFLAFTLTFSPLALALDIVGIVVYGLLVIAKKFLEGVLAAVIAICQKAIGTAAVIAAAVASVLIIYFKWQAISDFIKGLF